MKDGEFQGLSDLRIGNHLREALGRRAVTVYLHAPWDGAGGYGTKYVHPADGRLDAFMLARSGGPFAVGFDIPGSPLAEFCDGWINAGNVVRARAAAMNPAWRNLPVEQLNEGCRSYVDDFRRFCGHLQ